MFTGWIKESASLEVRRGLERQPGWLGGWCANGRLTGIMGRVRGRVHGRVPRGIHFTVIATTNFACTFASWVWPINMVCVNLEVYHTLWQTLRTLWVTVRISRFVFTADCLVYPAVSVRASGRDLLDVCGLCVAVDSRRVRPCVNAVGLWRSAPRWVTRVCFVCGAIRVEAKNDTARIVECWWVFDFETLMLLADVIQVTLTSNLTCNKRKSLISFTVTIEFLFCDTNAMQSLCKS